MRVFTTIALIIGSLQFSLAQEFPVKIPPYPTPPNGVQIDSNFFMDETEIANIHWLEYLYYLRNDSSHAQYLAALPDTTVWQNADTSQLSTYLQHYLRYPGFRYFPVVGISHAQAQRYCHWRSAVVNAKYARYEGLKRKYKNWLVEVNYRLPKALEWEKVASAPQEPFERAKMPATHYIYNLPPNSLGIFGLHSNVSEMVQGGIVKGPNFKTWHEKASPLMEISFSSPDKLTGFRCACEVTMTYIPPEKDTTATEKSPMPSFDTTPPAEYILAEDKLIIGKNLSPLLYPNPAIDVLNIEKSGGWQGSHQKMTLSNSMGNIIAVYPLRAVPHQTIPLGLITPGIYLVTITDGDNSYKEKIVLMKQ